MTITDNEYVCPMAGVDPDRILRYLQDAVVASETFIRNQPAAVDFEKARNIIAGLNDTKIPQQLSRLNVNLTKRLIRDIVSTMSNLRPLWGYTTDNPELDQTSSLLNKLLLNWYQTTFVDRSIKKALQYGAVFGTGYIGPDWKKDFWTRGRGEIALNVYSPEDVLPHQIPKDNDIQRAYAVTLREEVPINLARAMFPTLADKIVPDRTAPGNLRKGLSRLASFLSPVLNRFGATQRAKKSIDKVFPVVDIFQTYVMDPTVNIGPDPVVMGEPGAYWSYIVPVLGSDIPDTRGGTRKATIEDAMLYPFRRLITWCNSTILRDGPSYWWHGMVPAVPIHFDTWAWEFLGFSMTRDLASLEESSNTLRRAMDDSTNARLRPPLMYDDRSISASQMESIDTRVPGQAIGVDFSGGENPIRPIVPLGHYEVPQSAFMMVEKNDEMMKYLAGVNDMAAVTKAAQIPSSDTVEKIFEQAGPMVTDISRGMEASLGRLGEMIKCMFFEFYTAKRRLEILGKDGLTQEDTSYFDPATLVPGHLPEENPERPSIYSAVERARRYMNNFYFKIVPNSLHNITQMSRKLLYIQLQKAGIPMDPWTLADVMDIPNFGRPPEGADTVFKRWIAFETIKGELTAAIQAKSQEILVTEQMKLQQAAQAQQMAAQQAAVAAMPNQPVPGSVPPQSAPQGGAPPNASPQ